MRLAAAVVLFACSGTAHQISLGAPPARSTDAILAGPLCAGRECTCRSLDADGDGGAGVPGDPGRKRFEIRLTSPQELWATVGTNHLYKSPERVEACFYVDLPPGQAPVELRMSNPDGAAGGAAIRELGTRTKSFYDAFLFTCGVPGVCSFDELDGQKATYAAMPHGMHDRCGSTKVVALSWDHSKAPDGQHPTDVVVRLKLDVHRFAPWKAHGDATCGQGKPPADAGHDEGDAAEGAADSPSR